LSRAWLAVLSIALIGPAWGEPPCAPRAETSGYEPAPIDPGRRVLHVGPGRELATPEAAARAARSGDVVLIDAATYRDTRAVWPQDRLLIRGVNGRPDLVAGENLAQGKAIWVIDGDEVAVENVEFSAARSASGNGAGIRAQGRRLAVRAAYFHDNDTGLLSDNDPDQEITIEYSEFARNGHADGRAHNLYIGAIRRFELRFSSSSGARTGHLVKSRAKQNLIAYNRLADLPAGPSSYELDFPRSTDALVIGNLIVQSATSPNAAVLSYGAEDNGRPPEGRLRVASNTFVSLRSMPVFVLNRSPEPALVFDNVFGGAAGETIRGPAIAEKNVSVHLSGFIDSQREDFRLNAQTVARIAVAAGAPRPAELVPQFEYVHPLTAVARPPATAAQPGAFSFCLEPMT